LPTIWPKTPAAPRISAVAVSASTIATKAAVTEVQDARDCIAQCMSFLKTVDTASPCSGGSSSSGSQRCLCCRVAAQTMSHPAMSSQLQQRQQQRCVLASRCLRCCSDSHVMSDSGCVIRNARFRVSDQCVTCGMAGGSWNGHVDKAGQKLSFGSRCGSTAQNVLLPFCWWVWRDHLQSARALVPREVTGDLEFANWLFSSNRGQPPNAVCLFVFMLSSVFRLIATPH
jgi:hypothetical protein